MKQVLIVDDDRRTRRVLQILVERLGLESHAFESAERPWRRSGRNPPR